MFFCCTQLIFFPKREKISWCAADFSPARAVDENSPFVYNPEFGFGHEPDTSLGFEYGLLQALDAECFYEYSASVLFGEPEKWLRMMCP